MKLVRLGIIGIGNMGTNHLKSLEAGKVPELEVTAVADRQQSRRDWCKEQFGEKFQIYKDGIALMDRRRATSRRKEGKSVVLDTEGSY